MKCLVFLLAVAFIGCRDPNRYTVFRGQGRYLTAKDEIPTRAISIANALERFPRDPTEREFESVLTASGLKTESDWFKDFEHIWYFDDKMNRPAEARERAYMVTVSYYKRENSRVAILNAGIHKKLSQAPWRETVWQIQYSKW